MGVTPVTITSNSANILLSNTAGGVGSSSITVNVPNGGLSGSFFIQALADTGSGTFTASASGFTPRTGTVNFAPSGLIITSVRGEVDPNVTSTNPFGRTMTLTAYSLEAGTNVRIDLQAVRGGLTLSPTINSSAALGVVFPAISLVGGNDLVFATFTNTSQGTTVLSIVQPSGFVTPASIFSTITVTINN